MALHDLAGQRLGVPVYELLGIAPGPTPETSFTIGLDTPEVVAAKVREASAYAILKVKMGSDDDRAVLEAVRDTRAPPADPRRRQRGLDPRGRARAARMAAPAGGRARRAAAPRGPLRGDARPAPVEPAARSSPTRASIAPQDIPRLAGAFDGINIKLMKCGGLGEALRMIAVARAHGMKVMLGCMIESSLAITAAAHLAPLVDATDLDGNLLVDNDPFVGATLEGGRLVLPRRPGLGVRPAPASYS